MSMQVAAIFAPASETKTAIPSRANISDQMCSARSGGCAVELTSDTRKRSSNRSRSDVWASLALGIWPPVGSTIQKPLPRNPITVNVASYGHSLVGTFPTWRSCLTMSVHRGRSGNYLLFPSISHFDPTETSICRRKPRLREHHQQCLAMLRGRPVVASLRQPASDSFVVFTCWLIRFRRIWSIADSSSVKFSNNSARALACFEMRRDQSLRLLFIFPSYSSKAATPTTNSGAFSG